VPEKFFASCPYGGVTVLSAFALPEAELLLAAKSLDGGGFKKLGTGCI